MIDFILTSADISNFNSKKVELRRGSTVLTSGATIKSLETIRFYPTDSNYKIVSVIWRYQQYATWKDAVFTIQGDGDIAQYTTPNGTSQSFDAFIIVTEPRVIAPDYVITQNDLNILTNSQSVIKKNGSELVLGTELFWGDVLTIEALNNRVFREFSAGFKLNAAGTPTKQYFNFDEELGSGSLTLSYGIIANTMIEGVFSETFQKRPPLIKGHNNIYVLNDIELNAFTTGVFTRKEDDYTKYILGLINLPFLLNDDEILENERVILGDVLLTETGTLLATDAVRFNVGEIFVESPYKDFRAYKEVELILNLPFYGSVTIAPEYAINQTISIEYLISLYDGSCLILISSSLTGNVFNSIKCDLNLNIPFTLSNSAPARNKAENIELGGDNGNYQANIDLIQNKLELIANEFNYSIKERGILKGYVGYCSVDEINLNGDLLSEEKERIKDILQNGILIK